MDAGAETGQKPVHPIGSVENALRLLLMLRDSKAVRVSEVSDELDVARSTAHRLLAMLRSYELVEQDPGSRVYRAGPALAELGLSALRHDDVLSALHPFVRELSERVDETVHLLVLDGPNCRFVDSVECQQALRTTARVGIVYPAYATSGGKVLLAELERAQLERLFPERDLAPLNERSLKTRDELFAELERIRGDGYATNFGESEMGIFAVAMAQRTSSGAVPAAIAISAPEQRFSKRRLPSLVEALKDVTDKARPRLR